MSLKLLPILGLACSGQLPEVKEGHRACVRDSDCALLVGCGGCDLDAVNVDFVDEYDQSCIGYHGGQCGRTAPPGYVAVVDKWSCSWEAVCETGACTPACP